MKYITLLITTVSLMVLNLSLNITHEVTIGPPSIGTIVLNGAEVTKPITIQAESVKISRYLEPGLGWAQFEIHGKKKASVSYRSSFLYVIPQITVRLVNRRQKEHGDFSLRICAIAAPYWVSNKNPNQRLSLNSRTPFSLQNALRCVAEDSIQGNLDSNWSDPKLLEESMFLLDDADDDTIQDVQNRLETIQPNILYIGSMTLSFPGAVEIARKAKLLFGENILVVLGGRHVNETFYKDPTGVKHHKGSPLLLMEQGRIERVFDLVVSGDGEDISKVIANIRQHTTLHNQSIENFFDHVQELKTAKGSWVAGWIDKSGIKTITGDEPLDRSHLPVPAEMFGVNACFPVFKTDYTAHVYSDSGRGCVRDCSFCSERHLVTGVVQNPSGAADRLFNQLLVVRKIGESNGCSISAFVEDSILLMGSVEQLSRLAGLMEESKFYLKFGGQFTINDLTDPRVQQQIRRLQKYGLSYIYTGMETIDQKVAIDMSKNRKKEIPWLVQNRNALDFVSESGLNFGVSVLFGLGESQEQRLLHLDTLIEWQREYQNPLVVSLNWATEHPLLNKSQHDFVDWGTEKEDSRLPLLQEIFGEASAKYCFNPLPSFEELAIIADKFRTLNNRT